MQFRTATIALALAALTLAGCESKSESDLPGKMATIEYRPILTDQTSSLHKQRSGKILGVNDNWVGINENGYEIWIPRDMVLEIRLDKK